MNNHHNRRCHYNEHYNHRLSHSMKYRQINLHLLMYKSFIYNFISPFDKGRLRFGIFHEVGNRASNVCGRIFGICLKQQFILADALELREIKRV